MANIFQQQIVPNKPKVLNQERIYVYMPDANEEGKGLASFNQEHFNSSQGHVSLKWPAKLLIEDLADPTVRPSFTKVISDEFVKTHNPVSVLNPNTDQEYASNSAEIKLNRENRNVFTRPDLVMLNTNDFDKIQVAGPNGEQYSRYDFKRNNPLVTPSLIRVDNIDFKRENNIVKVDWPYAHTGKHGLTRIANDSLGNLKFDNNNNLEVDLSAIKTNLSDHLAIRPVYTTPNYTVLDSQTGLAKRDINGNTLLHITKAVVGLNNVENRTFASRTYDEFGQSMKNYFTNRFNSKLDKSKWDGPSGLFRDWAPPSDDRNTVQRWFMRLEEEDNSLWSSIRTLRIFLGFFANNTDLNMTYPPDATLFASHAYIAETSSYWSIRAINPNRYQFVYRDNTGLESIVGQQTNDRTVNLNNGSEYVWNGTDWVYEGKHPEEWEWFNSEVSDPLFMDYVEADAASLQPNAPVANVSVGTSGKWIQSDHVHPSDPGKLDAWLIEDANIIITTDAPTGQDFNVPLAKMTILDSDLSPIEATVVTTSQYLNSVPDPQIDDLAIARSNGRIFEWTGSVWEWTGRVGSITYDTNSVINIPYVRTGQHLHNWKNSPTLFQQDENSNEYYWAGSKEEFESLDISDLPNGAFVHVSDDENLIPGNFSTIEQIEAAGLKVSDLENISSERFITIDRNTNLDGLPLALTRLDANLDRSERRRLTAFNFGDVLSSPPEGHRMVITVPTTNPNGTTLARRSFIANRIIQSDTQGNLDTTDLDPANLISTDEDLVADKIVIANDTKSIKTWGSGTVENRPIVSNGEQGIDTLTLSGNRIVKTDTNGGLTAVSWLEANILKTNNSITIEDEEEVPTTLASGRVAVTANDNTIGTWDSGGSAGSLIERGANAGQIRVRTTGNKNRLLLTDENGKIQELSKGESNQYLVGGGDNAPGWADRPTDYKHLPQTMFTGNPTNNPSNETANALEGLAAVILDAPIDVSEMRNNCMYYF